METSPTVGVSSQIQLPNVHGSWGFPNSDDSGPSPSSGSVNSGPSHSPGSDYATQYEQSTFKAVQSEEWTNVNKIVQNNSVLKIKALHAAASWGKLDIVKNLVNSMTAKEIEDKDSNGFTALASAALTGKVRIAECMIGKNKNLVKIPNNSDQIPVTLAVLSGQMKMAYYLYSVTPLETLLPENGRHGAMLLNQCFLSNKLDFALHLLRQIPSLAVTQDEQDATLVWALAGKPSAFLSGCQLLFWQRWIYNWIQIDLASAIQHIPNNVAKCEPGLLHQLIAYIFKLPGTYTLNLKNLIGIKRIYDSKLTHVLSTELLRITCDQIGNLTNVRRSSRDQVYDSLFRAAECGIPEFIIEVMKTKPNLLTITDHKGRNLFFKAVQFRQAKVFNLIYGFHSKNAVASSEDVYANTLLHMAAKLKPSTRLNQISGAALQMQRELQWFKEVESIVQPVKQECKNKSRMTARESFTKDHKDLVKEGEEWMKQTASSCTVVAALIVTIMFTASITVPGGNDQTTGYPMFQDHKYFKLFIIADAVSLVSSTTSLLMFLAILTSRYAEDDFLRSLPTKLIIGLSMLFISLAAMMISFFASISVMLPQRLWIIIPVISFAIIPTSLFLWLLSPLLCEIFISTYGSGIFERNMKPWI